MSPERKEKLSMIRQKMANLTEEQKNKLLENGMIATVEGRVLSSHNTILLAVQGIKDTVVAGYQQWKKAGRQVKQGEHGAVIWIPAGPRDKETGNLIEAENFFCATVFGQSQTELILN
jgi:hypothetical protein